MVLAQMVATVLLALWARALVRSGRAGVRVLLATVAGLAATTALTYFGIRIADHALDRARDVSPAELQQFLADQLHDGYQLVAIAWGGLTLLAIGLSYATIISRRALPTARALRAPRRDRPQSTERG